MNFGLTHLTPSLHRKLTTDITEFRTSFGLPINGAMVNGLSKEDDALHTSLAVEELNELATARNNVEIADAVVDTVYVLIGREVQVGEWLSEIEVMVDMLLAIADKNNIPFVKIWDIVHSSNMSKLCKDDEDFEKSKRYYSNLGVPVFGEKQPNGMIAIKSKENVSYVDTKGMAKNIKKGKVLKSVSYNDASDLITEMLV